MLRRCCPASINNNSRVIMRGGQGVVLGEIGAADIEIKERTHDDAIATDF